jgi:AraC-like DNA-binding protein
LTMDAERPEFQDAVQWLPGAVPEPDSLQEADELNMLLRICAVNAATTFHRNYHRREAQHGSASNKRSLRRQCQSGPIEAAMAAWKPNAQDQRTAFEAWAHAFLCAFDATHPLDVVAQAAAILRAEFRNPPELDLLARRVGCSRSNLTLRFHQRYGISCGEYVTRVRLAWFVSAVRESGSSACHLAEQAGYSRYHNLCAALRSRTGLTAHEIRDLSSDEFLELRTAKLALESTPNAQLPTGRSRQLDGIRF